LQGFSYFFDYVIYPPVLVWLGLLNGTIVLFLVLLVLNYFVILIYDKLRTDLFGFEQLKELKSQAKTNSKKTFIQRVILWGDIPAFIAFSWYDPIFAVLYKRDGAQFDGFKKRDYFILVLSTFTGCLLWSAVLGPLGFLIKKAWFYFCI